MNARRLAMLLLMCAYAGLASAMSSGASVDPRLTEVKLENGLTVLLRTVEGADQVAVVTLFSLGEDQDQVGHHGLAHVVEHLYTCCAAGRSPSRTAEQFMRSYPAGWNAFTGDDFTVYATVVPRERLAGELEDASARMAALKVTVEELNREKGRVLAEVSNMFGGIPALAAMNLAREQVRPGPLGSRHGGMPEQVKAITIHDIRARLDRYYKPCNATIVVAGGFDLTGARAHIERLFARLPPGEPAPAPSALQAPVLGTVLKQTAQSRQPSQAVQVGMAYPAPRPDSPAYAAFLILATRLAVRQNATTPDAQFRLNFAPLDDPSLLFIGAVPQGNEEPKATIDRLTDLVARVSGEPWRPDEAQTVLYGFGSVVGLTDRPESAWRMNLYGLAFSIGRRRQMGIDTVSIREAIAQMTSERLRATADEWLSPKRRAAVVVQPAE